jgi:hypothetical protein
MAPKRLYLGSIPTFLRHLLLSPLSLGRYAQGRARPTCSRNIISVSFSFLTLAASRVMLSGVGRPWLDLKYIIPTSCVDGRPKLP